MLIFKVVGLAFLTLALSNCTKKSESPPSPAGPSDNDALVTKGKSVYNTTCIACHSVDPGKDGTLGPAVKGSTLELLEARVMRAEYPPGHTPKRTSKVMVALPQLKEDLPAIHAYLNQ